MEVPCIVYGEHYRYPPGCKPTAASLSLDRGEPARTWRQVDGFCVDEEFRAVWPGEVCGLLDDLASGKPVRALLLGPPGTGKSMLLKKVRRVWRYNTVWLEPESLKRSLYGESEKALNSLLDKLERMEPSLLLIDEGDMLIIDRDQGPSTVSTGDDVRRSLINIMLRRLQEWTDEGRAIGVLVSSNEPLERIDRALVRSGRIGRVIYFPPPSIEAIRMLARLHGREVSDEEARKLAVRALSFANVVEYLRTGRMSEFNPFPFAKIVYPDADVTLTEQARRNLPRKLIIAEEPPLGEKLAAVLAAAAHGKPLMVLLDHARIREIEWLHKGTGYPIAVHASTTAVESRQWITVADATVYLVGPQWANYLSYRVVRARDVAAMIVGGERALVKALGCTRCRRLDEIRAMMT